MPHLLLQREHCKAYRSVPDNFPTEDGIVHITQTSFSKMVYKEVSVTFNGGPSSVLHAFVPKATTLLSQSLLNQQESPCFDV